jgi:hypothetical protein
MVWVKLLEDLRLKWVHGMGMDNLKITISLFKVWVQR